MRTRTLLISWTSKEEPLLCARVSWQRLSKCTIFNQNGPCPLRVVNSVGSLSGPLHRLETIVHLHDFRSRCVVVVRVELGSCSTWAKCELHSLPSTISQHVRLVKSTTIKRHNDIPAESHVHRRPPERVALNGLVYFLERFLALRWLAYLATCDIWEWSRGIPLDGMGAQMILTYLTNSQNASIVLSAAIQRHNSVPKNVVSTEGL
jgi:hypothetical protein